MSTKQLVWLITGTSTGFGRELTLAALQKGDKVIAMARSLSKIKDLEEAGANILEFDVTWPLEKLHETAKQAIAFHGHVDVLVNNAAYLAVGALEENTPEETYQQFNTNIFGALNVSRAILPYMRSRRTGTIVWIGSLAGWQGIADSGLYCATKHAVRGLSLSLNLEIAPLGLRSINFDPGAFRTALLSEGHRPPYNPRIEDYKEITEKRNEFLKAFNNNQPGDAKKFVQVMLDVIRGEGVAQGREIPDNLPLGTDCLTVVKQSLAKTNKVIADWEDVIKSTDFTKDS
ncbi:hypothetical protein M422DRAFT_29420 [Sphaerobolus stellatus SS14]|uniref:NAD(P)-binding protein n=1 Tax=Sphaerobolus stellatus (strain SS14) TaxID=990650 RepID=A0A0C9VTR0_SPHS4|nr:hypothetical protein M422DRAFT_29420 [Sphaerobolus stellatus SS14]